MTANLTPISLLLITVLFSETFGDFLTFSAVG